MPLLAPPDPYSRLETRLSWLRQLALQHEQVYCSYESRQARLRQRAQHPTALFALKCMDGRLNLSVATQTPPGHIQPLRNLGGVFNLGWPYLSEVLHKAVERASRDNRQSLILITYHYSKGAASRGCAGFGYDVDAARAHAEQLRRQVLSAYGGAAGGVHPLVCGYETDEDALTLHGPEGDLQMATLPQDCLPSTLNERLGAICPLLPWDIRRDLIPLLEGNLRHLHEMRASQEAGQRELEVDHREWIIGIGRGFDWLHTPNQALLIGPYSPNLAQPIRTAARIISENMSSGRVSPDGFLLWSCVPYELPGTDRAKAVLRASFFIDFAADEIRRADPALAAVMKLEQSIIHWPTRRVEWGASPET